MAQGRFRFLWYLLPVCAFKMVLVYCVTGYTFFTGLLPQPWLDAVAAFNPNRLSVVLWTFLTFQLLLLPCLLFDAFGRHRAGT